MAKKTDENKEQGISRFMEKALKKFESRKERKTAKLHITSLDEEITIQSLYKTEIHDALKMDDTENAEASDNFILYNAVVEPNLKEIAKEWKSEGRIVEYMEVCDIFDMAEKVQITQQILELSGASNKNAVVLVEDLKN